ncbi:2Fe-2S iron-sulfur cluster-binding protein [Mycolicibacterium sp.]|uniref:2Fe-2S iron-sulfur cluster-binding protein n=1 Tax=Mycolicibacterium sp. TaxID=2320850 RepID=UPI0037CAC094
MKLFGRGSSEPRIVKIAGTNRTFEAAGKDSILNEALAAGIPYPHSCTVGTCGTCKSKLLHGRVREIVDSAVALTAEELRDGYILTCQSIARTPLELEVAGLADMPDHPLVHAEGSIVRQRNLTHDIIEVTIDLDNAIEYTAGQYAELRVAGVNGPRSYSFADVPSDDGNHITFCVRLVPDGEFTEWLFSAPREGAAVTVTGPFGDLWLRPRQSPILCVAGGSGLAPIKAILKEAVIQGCDRDTVLVFGARTQQDLYSLEEIEQIGEAWKAGFEFHPILSMEPTESGWPGARGLVTSVLDTLPADFVHSCDVYTCGPPAMIDALESELRNTRTDIDLKHFYADRFLTRVPGAAQVL